MMLLAAVLIAVGVAITIAVARITLYTEDGRWRGWPWGRNAGDEG
jgi:hypothetical protein